MCDDKLTAKEPDVISACPPPPATGWVCPRCGRVNAPWVAHCDCTQDVWPSWPQTPPWTTDPNAPPYTSTWTTGATVPCTTETSHAKEIQ